MIMIILTTNISRINIITSTITTTIMTIIIIDSMTIITAIIIIIITSINECIKRKSLSFTRFIVVYYINNDSHLQY